MKIAERISTDKFQPNTTIELFQDCRPDLYVVKLSTFNPHASNPDGTCGTSWKREYQVRIENGSARWGNSSNFVPLDCIENYMIDQIPGFDFEEHKRLRSLDIDRVLSSYRERMKNYVPSDEELYEMRAAFGAGEQVVNIVTGAVTQL